MGARVNKRGVAGVSSSNIIISSLTGDPRLLYETIMEFESLDVSLYIPTKPWRWQASLMQTSKVYDTFLKNLDRLQQQGIRIHHTPGELPPFK